MISYARHVFAPTSSSSSSSSSSRQSSSRRASCSSSSSSSSSSFERKCFFPVGKSSMTTTFQKHSGKRYARYPSLAPLRATPETEQTKEEEEKEDIPPWERRELEKKAQQESGELPWPLFLLGSLITLLAATGSCFEWTFSKPIFGVVESTSGLYKPILGWFIVTGFPLSAFLWTKGIEGANKASELTDKLDGYD